MSSTSTTWTTDTNTKSGVVQIYESNVSVLKILGIEGGSSILELFADQGDDNADKWRMWVNASDDDLHFANYTSGAWADLLTIQDGGNVGIGTDSPETVLDIWGKSGAVNPILSLVRYETPESGVGADGDDGLGSIQFKGQDSSSTTEVGAKIMGTATAAWHADQYDKPSALWFYTQSDGTDNGLAIPRMGISSAGYVGIGTGASTAPATLLEVRGPNANTGFDSAGVLTLSTHDASITKTTLDQLGRINFQAPVEAGGGDAVLVSAAIWAEACQEAGGGGFSSSQNNTAICFSTAESETALQAGNERMRITSSGNVGIGTISPAKRLHIEDTADNADVIALTVVNNDYASTETGQSVSIMGSVMGASSTLVSCGKILFGKDDDFDDAAARDGHIAFHTRLSNTQAEKMRITSDGYVGIGTASPETELEIVSSLTGRPNIFLTTSSTSELHGGALVFRNAETDGFLQEGKILGEIFGKMYDSTDEDYLNTAGILFKMDDDGANNVAAGNIIFQTNPGSASLAEVMRIDKDGNVGIGAATPAQLLHIQGASGFDGATPVTLRIQSSNNGTWIDEAIPAQIEFATSDVTGAGDGGAKCAIKLYADSTGGGDLGLSFYTTTNGTTMAEQMRIDHTGNVGIGTTSPVSPLEVAVNGDGNAFMSISSDDDSAGSASNRNAGIKFRLRTLVKGTVGYDSSDDVMRLLYATSLDAASGISIDSSGNVGIGSTSPAALLELQQGAVDTSILKFVNADVSHAMTDEVEADVFGNFHKANVASGGLTVEGYKDADGGQANAMILKGCLGEACNVDPPASGVSGIVSIQGSVVSSNTIGAAASDSNIFAVRNHTSTLFIIDAEGDIHNDGADSAAFDEYDDAQLVRALDLSHGKNVINSKFDEFVKYNHEKLAELRLVGREADGTPNHFINVTGMQRLHNGAIWQQYAEMQKVKELMYETMVELMGKEKADKKLINHDIKLLNENPLN